MTNDCQQENFTDAQWVEINNAIKLAKEPSWRRDDCYPIDRRPSDYVFDDYGQDAGIGS